MAKDMKLNWTSADIPSQKGRSVVITGTGGIGYEIALAMTRAGAEVIMAGRNRDKGEEAIKRINTMDLAGNIRFEKLDLADLASIKAFGEGLKAERKSLDILSCKVSSLVGRPSTMILYPLESIEAIR